MPNQQNNPSFLPERPTIKSMSIFMQLLRVLFFIKGVVFFITAIVALIGGSSVKIITDTTQIPSGTDKSVLDFISTETVILGISLLFLSFTLLFAAWICKRVIIRNKYIISLEEKIKIN